MPRGSQTRIDGLLDHLSELNAYQCGVVFDALCDRVADIGTDAVEEVARRIAFREDEDGDAAIDALVEVMDLAVSITMRTTSAGN